MIVLAAREIRKHFGPEPVLDGVTFEVRPGDRIGLVGANGSGKTTLLRILAGWEEPDGGSVERHPSVRLEYLQQQAELTPGRTVWQEAEAALGHFLVMQKESIRVAEAISHAEDPAERRRLTARYDHLQQELQRHDAYHLDHKVERVLDGLGFRRESHRQTVESLSGGEQNRLMLAKLLLAESDVMLLDEPSNHLDIGGTEWLEEYLAESQAAMLLVSHDRYFLDRVTNRTLELFRGTVDEYTGNFSAYGRQKAERLAVERRTYERQQTEIAKAKEFIRRNAYGQKHAQAEDRRKKLQRIEPVDPPREITAPPMAFPPAERSGDLVIRAEHLSKGFDRPLFAELTFDVLRGQRWAVLGPNGSGKTTLLKCLLGQETPDAGRAVLGRPLKIGYFDQHLAALDDDLPAVDAIRPSHKDFLLQQRRDLLARFGLTGDTALQRVASLSGGERCRAALAWLAASDANLLVLDEPTNHLDLWARGALEKALKAFDGTVLFVSHDRYFIDQVADHLLVAEGGTIRVVDGNYQTYLHLVRSRGAPRPVEADSATGSAPSEKPSPCADDCDGPPRRKRRFPFRKVEDIEADILEREARLDELHALLAQPETHRNGDRARQVKAEIETVQESLTGLYEHWEEATELNW